MGTTGRLFVSVLATAAVGLARLAEPVFAQSSAGSAPVAATPLQAVAVDKLEPPREKQIVKTTCDSLAILATGSNIIASGDPEIATCNALLQGTEGWVEVGFMIDSAGKPFEVAVERSTGNRTFEKMAIQSIEASSFVPATVNGQPVESNAEIKLIFMGDSPTNGASPEFIGAYKTLITSVNAGDRPAADRAMAQLKITNLYEDAFYGLAGYAYAAKWGDEQQQLEALLRAGAGEDHARYLPREAFKAALLATLGLELKMRWYAEALRTWGILGHLGIDVSAAKKIGSVIDKVKKIQTDGTEYEVSGQMPEGAWGLDLFKENFRVVVDNGSISDVKLKCNRGYVSFKFDAAMQYHTPFKNGACWMQLSGSPGTRFRLVQF